MKKIHSIFIVVLIIIINTGCSQTPTNSKKISPPDITSFISYTTQIKVKWNSITDAKKYEIRYATDKDMSNATVKKTNSANLDITQLQPATTYYFQIRVYVDEMWSDWLQKSVHKTATFSTTVGTFNVFGKGEDPDFPKHKWKNRKLAVKNIILQQNNNPDILGLQEAKVISQAHDLVTLLSEKYSCHISSRETDTRVICWKTKKYNLVNFGNLNGYAKADVHPRYVTYAHLKEKATGKDLLVFNIHPSAGRSAKKQQLRGVLARAVSAKAKELSHKYNAPTVVLGDFNNYPNTVIGGYPPTPEVFAKHGFVDTFVAAAHKTNANYATHTDITKGVTEKGAGGSKRIDYIFYYPADRVAVSDYRIIINFKDNSDTVLQTPIPSDHRPVRSTIYLVYQ
jgi:exonuclease III